MMRTMRPMMLAMSAALLVVGCTAHDDEGAPPLAAMGTPEAPEPLVTMPATDDATPSAAAPTLSSAAARPTWLGTRVLPLAADGFGQRLATPEELIDRRLVTPTLPHPTPPPPRADGEFDASIADVPPAVAARSTWHEGCPVTLAELRYLTVTFHGFDQRMHTGELIVHEDVADDVVRVFAALHAGRFPIEELRIIAADELSAPPTGDGNVTSAFVCRATVGGSRWSDHAFGRAIDVNPFHNPYVRGDLVIPELAGAYVDRRDVRPGMVIAGDAVTRAFATIGWGWGGDWTGSATDPMHFSASGR